MEVSVSQAMSVLKAHATTPAAKAALATLGREISSGGKPEGKKTSAPDFLGAKKKAAGMFGGSTNDGAKGR